ncbi:hypothetical protein BOSE127_120111 [Bosea sp. 127]|nr:hypothetical protein BOSE7B_60649 [Bosea sp. 7B]VXB46606.1 hypothetical protein BOSE127_120111 [Bosea sp. 127]VXC71509.1 hypothetical protein BOSE29B_80018 [Bosea sp. 29B]
MLAEPLPDPPLPELPSPLPAEPLFPLRPLPPEFESLLGPPDDKAPVVNGGHIQYWLPPC